MMENVNKPGIKVVEKCSSFERTRDRVRIFCIILIALGVFYARDLDEAVERVWHVLRVNPIVKHDSFEPILSSLSFALWLWLLYFVDRFGLLEHYRINQGAEHDTRWNWKSVKAVFAYLTPLLVFDYVYPRRQLPKDCPGFFDVIAKVVQTIFVYDLLFFFVHLLLHKWKALRFIEHGVHHSKQVLASIEVVNHSFVDGTLQVSANIVALRLCQAHPLARALHDIVITYLLTELHAGYDAPWMIHNLVPYGILGGPPAHEEHHRSGLKHYQQFFTYLDAIHDRVAA